MNSFLQSYGISMENAKSLFRFYVETSFLFLIPYICPSKLRKECNLLEMSVG